MKDLVTKQLGVRELGVKKIGIKKIGIKKMGAGCDEAGVAGRVQTLDSLNCTTRPRKRPCLLERGDRESGTREVPGRGAASWFAVCRGEVLERPPFGGAG